MGTGGLEVRRLAFADRVDVKELICLLWLLLLGSSCCPSVEASLTEAPAPSLLHIEVKMALVSFIGTRSEHGAEHAAGVIVD
jgi:hypothetical protein